MKKSFHCCLRKVISHSRVLTQVRAGYNLKRHIEQGDYLQKPTSKYRVEDDYDKTSPECGSVSLRFLGGGMFVSGCP